MATDKLVDFDHVTDYISREAAYKTLTEYYHHSSGVQHTVLREALNRVPTADVRTVIAAAWNDNGNGTVSCSRCQTWFPKERLPYMRICGYCGADMRQERGTKE